MDLEQRRQVASIPVPGVSFEVWSSQIATTSTGKILVVDATATVIEVDPRTGAHRTVAKNAFWLTSTRDRTKVLLTYGLIQSYDSASGEVTRMHSDLPLTLPGALSADGAHWWIYRGRNVDEFDLELNRVRSSEVSPSGIIPLDEFDRLLGGENLIYQLGNEVADQSGFDGRANVLQHRVLLRMGTHSCLPRPTS